MNESAFTRKRHVLVPRQCSCTDTLLSINIRLSVADMQLCQESQVQVGPHRDRVLDPDTTSKERREIANERRYTAH